MADFRIRLWRRGSKWMNVVMVWLVSARICGGMGWPIAGSASLMKITFSSGSASRQTNIWREGSHPCFRNISSLQVSKTSTGAIFVTAQTATLGCPDKAVSPSGAVTPEPQRVREYHGKRMGTDCAESTATMSSACNSSGEGTSDILRCREGGGKRLHLGSPETYSHLFSSPIIWAQPADLAAVILTLSQSRSLPSLSSLQSPLPPIEAASSALSITSSTPDNPTAIGTSSSSPSCLTMVTSLLMSTSILFVTPSSSNSPLVEPTSPLAMATSISLSYTWGQPSTYSPAIYITGTEYDTFSASLAATPMAPSDSTSISSTSTAATNPSTIVSVTSSVINPTTRTTLYSSSILPSLPSSYVLSPLNNGTESPQGPSPSTNALSPPLAGLPGGSHPSGTARKLSISIPMAIGTALFLTMCVLYLWRRFHSPSFHKFLTLFPCHGPLSRRSENRAKNHRARANRSESTVLYTGDSNGFGGDTYTRHLRKYEEEAARAKEKFSFEASSAMTSPARTRNSDGAGPAGGEAGNPWWKKNSKMVTSPASSYKTRLHSPSANRTGRRMYGPFTRSVNEETGSLESWEEKWFNLGNEGEGKVGSATASTSMFKRDEPHGYRAANVDGSGDGRARAPEPLSGPGQSWRKLV